MEEEEDHRAWVHADCPHTVLHANMLKPAPLMYPACSSIREHFAKSDAWKRALPGFVPALERLPGLSMDQGHYDISLNPGLEEDDPGEVRECAACERLHSRATMELTFKGRPYWPDYKYGTK